MLDGKVFITVLQPLFPDALFHIGIPEKAPPRPYFTIIVPDDGKFITRASRFSYKETGTFYIYGHGKKETIVGMCERTIQALMLHPKIPIPESNRRYLTIEDVKSQTDEEHSAFELTVTGSRHLIAVNEDLSIQKIKEFELNIRIREEKRRGKTGGSTEG